VRTNTWDDRSVLGKAFTILDAFRPGDRWLRLADITERTGYPKATVHRLTNQLVKWGALQKIDNWLRLGPHLFEVGYMVPHFRLLRDAAGPLLSELHTATKLTVNLAVLETREEDIHVLYLDRLTGYAEPIVSPPVGGRGRTYTTALGKAMLAHSGDAVLDRVVVSGLEPRTTNTITERKRLRRELQNIRDAAVAYDHEETRAGVVCVAAPVFPPCPQLAAISLTAPRSVNLERMASTIRETAGMLTRTLHRLPSPATATAH
jgi:IclR family acetate operon transcriptional repressor